ncbi:MAG: glycosyltransferase family 9 protein [Gemmatimonadaceae bacterium]
MTPLIAPVEGRAFRKKRNLLLAYASELGAPVLRAAAALRSRGDVTNPRSWRRGLILGHTHLGDVLYRTCSLDALRHGLPGCEWTYATSPESAGILANNPAVSEVLPVIRGENSWNLADGGYHELASRQFDVVLCTNTVRHHPDIALATALGIPNRVAFCGRGFTGLINHPVPFAFPQVYPAYFRSMVNRLTDEADTSLLQPRLYPAAGDRDLAAGLFRRLRGDGGEPVVACALRTRQASGNWPASVMLEVLRAAREQRSFHVVFCGVGADRSALTELASQFPFPSSVSAGDAGVLGFAAFLEKCAVLFTLDSGPRHIGNAVGIPVLFARNLAHSMVEAGTYCDTETDIAPAVEYLDDATTAAVARSQSIGALAAVLLEAISASDRRVSFPRSTAQG